MRVVSLVPSVTESLLAWGVTPIGVTRFCEQPALLAVGGTKNPDVEAIVALRPDLVVVNVEENRREDALALERAGLSIHVVAIDSVDDVDPEMTRLRSAVGLDQEPEMATTAPPRREGSLRAFVPVWRRPWMSLSAGTYGSSLLAALGVLNVYADSEIRYPTTSLEEARSMSPDVVLAPSEPYPFAERHRPELETVAPTVLIDGQDLFWWGVRTPVALKRLDEVLTELRSALL